MAAGKRHLPLRAQRALKGRWKIDKREETVGFLPLARSAAAQAAFQPVKNWHYTFALLGEPPAPRRRNSPHLRSGHALTVRCPSHQRNILLRVDLFVVHLYLKVDMRAGRIACVAGERNLVALGNNIAHRNKQLRVVRI